MRPTFDTSILETKTFDHKTLGPFCYIVHEFSEPGIYRLDIKTNSGEVIFEGHLQFSAESKNANSHVDLYELGRSNRRNVIHIHTEQPHVLFYHSKQIVRCRIRAVKKGQRRAEFDSANPGSKDLYAINLIKPGEYEFVNKTTRDTSKLVLKYPSRNQVRTAADAAGTKQIIAVSKDKKVKSQDMSTLQGLVFQFDGRTKGFTLQRKKEIVRPKRKTVLQELKEEIKKRRKNRKVKKRARIRKDTWKVAGAK